MEYILSKNRGEKGYVGGPKCFDENPPLPGQHCLTGIVVTVHLRSGSNVRSFLVYKLLGFFFNFAIFSTKEFFFMCFFQNITESSKFCLSFHDFFV
jgi:hypothetical protein